MAKAKEKIYAEQLAANRKLAIEEARKNVEKYKKTLKIDSTRDGINNELYHGIMRYRQLADCYKTLMWEDEETYRKLMIKTCLDALDFYKYGQHKKPSELRNEKEKRSVFKNVWHFHILLAPYYFNHYLIAMEWNIPISDTFYTSRSNIILPDVIELDKLEKGVYKGLGISAPPRTYKTGLGTHFLSWVIGRHNDESSFFVSHTHKMCRKVYADILKLINKDIWKEIFPGYEISQSAEDLWIDITPKQHDNNYRTLYFAGIDSSMAGVIHCSWLLYCDDLISSEMEARNPDRIQNAWDKYASDVRQRRSGSKVRELHIATRWSTKDVVSNLENMKSGDGSWRFIKHPATDGKGKSNFMFLYNPMTAEHFEEIRYTMDNITYECLYQQNPMDREGLLFDENSLNRFKELPKKEPDEIFGACDVAFSGTDSLSFPVCYQYGSDVYIPDVVFDARGYKKTEPKTAAFIKKHTIQRIQFEANNGGDFYADDVRDLLPDYKCRITAVRAKSNIAKEARIEQHEPIISNFYFLDKSCYKRGSEYDKFMKELCGFNINGHNKHDDAPDSLAQCAAMMRVKPVRLKILKLS